MPMSGSTPLRAHLLEPDLRAIEEFGKLDRHDHASESRAAMALYEDVTWRAALVPTSGGAAQAVAALEVKAVALLHRYLGGESSPEAFWQDFGAAVAELDAVLDETLERARFHERALTQLQALRERVATAELPLGVRQTVLATLGLMNAEAAALLAGRLAPEDFDRVFADGQLAVEEAITAASPRLQADLQLHDLAERAFSVAAPSFLEGKLARALLAASDGLDAAHGPRPDTLARLASLVERAEAFQASHAAADERFRTLLDGVRRRMLPESQVDEAIERLHVLEHLLEDLDTGTLPPEAFATRFDEAARELEAMFGAQTAELAKIPGYERRVSEVRSRVAQASLPGFVATTVRQLLESVTELCQAHEPGDGATFDAALDGLLGQIEVCLEFGHDVLKEETLALQRFRALEARSGQQALAPLLRAPVEDALEVLRAMVHRLVGGLYPLASFHADFEREAARLETLLTWQARLAETEPPAEGGAGCTKPLGELNQNGT